MARHFFRRAWRKICFVKGRNDLLVQKALAANVERLRLALRIIPPLQAGMIIYLLLKNSPASAHLLWTKRFVFIHSALFFLEIILWLAISRRGRRVTVLQSQLALAATLLLIIAAGIVMVAAEEGVTGGVVPFILLNVVVGSLFLLRPGVAMPLYLLIYTLFSFVLGYKSLAAEITMASQLHGLFAVGLGLSLSVITWRGFYQASMQEEKIKAQQLQLEQMAYHDPLTGLPNRRFLDQIVKKDLALTKRGGYQSCLLVLDIDDFKEVNDTYGHPVGDLVLKKLASLLEYSLRDSDTVARVGGEEFVILLANTGLAGGLAVAEELRLLIQNHAFKAAGIVVELTASLGVALLTPDDTALSYYEEADRALYRAKALGKNRVRISEVS